MVTLKRLGKTKIEVRADHLPAHFHVTSPSSNVMVDLVTFEVIRGHGDAAELKSALEWAKANAADLISKWREING